MDDTCKSTRDNAPFTTNLNIENIICSVEVFWILCIVAFGVQILRNLIWIKHAQLQRETLALQKNNPKRKQKVVLLLIITFISFLLYVFAFLIIVGGNLWFLLSVLFGNLAGTAYGLLHEKADEHISQGPVEMDDITLLLKKSRTAADLSEREIQDIDQFKKKLRIFLLENASAQSVVNSLGTAKFKF